MSSQKKIQIRFSVDKNGKPLAHKWIYRADRYIKMNYDEAKVLVATGAAIEIYAQGA